MAQVAQNEKDCKDLKDADTKKSRLENGQSTILSGMPQHLVHELDFSKFIHGAVYRYGTTLASRGDLAGV